MRKSILTFSLIFLSFFSALAQKTGTIRGFVYDKMNENPVPFANLVIEGTKLGAVAADNGYYLINDVPAGEYTVKASFIGYSESGLKIKVTADRISSLNIYLSESTELLDEVEISAARKERDTKVLTSVVTLDPKEITRFSVGGDADIIKAVQVLPGVISTGDQGGQLYIRGGAPIQNLILLDGMIIYNPFHSIGFFSVFDNDIIRSADVYTGGFSAEYGSRNSAVMDVRTRSGNRRRFSGKLSSSTYTSKLLLEAPLGKKNKRGLASSSFLISAKTSYLDQTSDIFYPYVETEFDGLPFTFTDLYGKFSSQAENGSQINVFGFNFDDGVRYGGANSIDWNSKGAGFNFIAVPSSSKMLLSGDVSYSVYDVISIEPDLVQASSITGFNGGLDFTYFFRKSDELKFGIEAITYTTDFEIDAPLGRSVEQRENTTELGTFFKYRYSSNRLIAEPSIRVHYYGSQSEVSIEPRLGLKYNVNDWLRLKASGGMYSQNLMAGNSDRDVVNLFYGFLSGVSQGEVPSTFRGEEITSSLQKSTHYVAGFEVEITKEISVNIEGYIKQFHQITNLNRNQIYDESSSSSVGKPEILVKNFLVERGLANGVDFLVKYTDKNLYLWLAYSIGKVTRDDGITEYAPVFDRRHNLNFVANYSFGKDKSWEASLRYNFGTGFPFTPTQLFYSEQPFVDDRGQVAIDYDYTTENGEAGVLYGELNTRRLPNYHRVDASITHTYEVTEHQVLEVSLGATNIMNYDNIFFYNRDENKRVNQLPIMPTVSVSYTF
jgi:hypothetical protein